jgi:predicted glycoside hydrolase/deacetylase ChbG (UPF0249 family)
LANGVNAGIIEAATRGVVTSTSLMVRGRAAEAAGCWARHHPEVSTGLHVDLGEWVFRDGSWVAAAHVVDVADADAVSDEVSRQLDVFQRLVGRAPTHLDSHQHVHRREPARSCLVGLAVLLGIPLREAGAIRYCGDFYGQDGRGRPYHDHITLGALLALVDALPDGVTELSCHPGADTFDDIPSGYARERSMERAVLCDPHLPTELAARGVDLQAFSFLSTTS